MAKKIELEGTIVGIGKDIEYIKKELDDLKVTIKDGYVTRSEFDPVKRIVYGMVALILTAVVAALLGLVIMK